jgi:hypothetical protein
MRTALFLLLAAPLAAQEEARQGSVEFGYRAVSGPAGSSDAYRSIVNLGEGPKLFHLDFLAPREKNKLFDRLSLRADSWGGEPYNTANFEMSRTDWYRLTASYRNLAQFNRLPSFALGAQALDLRRRDGEFEFEFRPRAAISPFVAWSAASGLGSGLTHFVLTGNEYPVAGRLEDRTDLVRGGVKLTSRRAHAIIEQGGLRFRQNDSWLETRSNPGDVTTPYIDGQPLRLDSLDMRYRIRGTGYYSKAVGSISAARWLDVSGSYLYSRPSNDVNYTEQAAGHLVATQNGAFTSTSRLPHSSGWVTAELRPLERIRFVESWLTDRLNNSFDPLRWTWSRQQIEGFVDVVKGLNIRGGHRYEWADAEARIPKLGGPGESHLRRHVGLAGARYQAGRGFVAHAEAEIGRSSDAFFRTSARDYLRLRGQARIQPVKDVSLAGHWTVFDNTNPSPLGRYDWLSRSTGITAAWLPKDGQRFSIWTGYTRATIASDIPYLVPQSFTPARSIYHERSHTVTALAEFVHKRARLSAGGSAFVASGTRPTRLYEPTGRVLVPLRPRLSAKAEWRYQGFAEPGFFFDAGPSLPGRTGLEGFRAHLWSFALVAALK